ncbi:hypothetical protein ElyMa_001123700 [Elysia marginata]|uniref:Uncharacterized protein n=1 Tax=Elysia marginata TaxID=1093978 RepID=A0AAV4I019_9GAST|nr:hypothetical protein ElyMa_001123700 [Elysia marginata]
MMGNWKFVTQRKHSTHTITTIITHPTTTQIPALYPYRYYNHYTPGDHAKTSTPPIPPLQPLHTRRLHQHQHSTHTITTTITHPASTPTPAAPHPYRYYNHTPPAITLTPALHPYHRYQTNITLALFVFSQSLEFVEGPPF